MSQRIQRVNELLKQEISQIILREIDFKDIFVTITHIETSSDLRQAKVRISILPDKKRGLALQIIQKNIWRIQQALNKKLTMRCVPRIRFELDQGEANAQRVEEILSRMKK